MTSITEGKAEGFLVEQSELVPWGPAGVVRLSGKRKLLFKAK